MNASAETSDIRVVGLSGSLRRDSTNTALLRTAAELAPADVRVVIEPLHDIPLFDADVEACGLPPAVASLRAAVARADALLLAAPEYNHSVSGVLKNAIDWLSRGSPAPIDHLPAGLLSSAGGSGGRRAQEHLRVILAHNDLDVLDDSLKLPRGRDHIEHGRLVGDDPRRELADLLVLLRARVLAHRSAAGVA